MVEKNAVRAAYSVDVMNPDGEEFVTGEGGVKRIEVYPEAGESGWVLWVSILYDDDVEIVIPARYCAIQFGVGNAES